MFSGSYELSVDEKGRIAVPARYRAELAESCNSQLVVTQGPDDPLEIFPAPDFVKLAETIRDMDDRVVAEELMNRFIGLAVETEIDKQGRMLLPPLLRKRARLNGSVVLVGKIARFELWSRELWSQHFEDDSDARAAVRRDAFRNLKR